MQNALWDKLTSKYIKSINEDKNGDFAYEKLVNSLSVLSLCDNTGNALDLGCGDGRFTKELSIRFPNVVGVDYSKQMLKIAKKSCPDVKFILYDLEQSFPELNIKFDLIVCKLLLMYIKNIEIIAMESFKVLNPGGILVVSVTHPLKWVSEHLKGNLENKKYLGYLSETIIKGQMAQDKNLGIEFINRTFETYINTFTKYGFKLETVLETGAPDSFVVKYPSYLPFQKKPYRLNLKFIKP